MNYLTLNLSLKKKYQKQVRQVLRRAKEASRIDFEAEERVTSPMWASKDEMADWYFFSDPGLKREEPDTRERRYELNPCTGLLGYFVTNEWGEEEYYEYVPELKAFCYV